MGRGRVVLKRIENKISRQVTFSKRRGGLLKKAHEISVLCEADVALIVFSTKGKLFEYSTDSRVCHSFGKIGVVIFIKREIRLIREHMGRGRVELKRIENKINRQVTFAKRRNGLLKKAYELSVLCDAEVALIIFSNRGKLYEFCSTSSMLKTLERYQKCSYGAVEVNKPAKELEQSSYREYLKLKGRFEGLQRTQRNLLGEDLGPLNSKDLEQLERQLDSSLKHVRSIKVTYS
ncbi:hypothetical protein LWI28_006588 [Acer negundo]|uniref:Uncharacterized protein n=2 Tax=Acer negundo TaxID=4023 RepID=A0AAD5NED6_ACENE|nr:hypothetical protein LWI28_006588 [Acer negundo]